MLPAPLLEALRGKGTDGDTAAALDAIYSGLVLEGEDEAMDQESSEELCAALRRARVPQLCAELMAHGRDSDVSQRALLLLSALTTRDCDPRADETKRALLHSMSPGILVGLLLRHLASDAVVNASSAAAAILNIFADEPRLPMLMHARGASRRLDHLSRCNQHPCLVHVSSLCLASLAEATRRTRALHAAIRLQRQARRMTRATSASAEEEEEEEEEEMRNSSLWLCVPHSPVADRRDRDSEWHQSPRRVRSPPSLSWEGVEDVEIP